MAPIHTALIGLLALSGVLAQVPSYTVTYTAYSKSINTLLEPSTTSTHSKLIDGLYDVGKATTLTADQNTTYYQFLDDLETNVINLNQTKNETTKLYLIGKRIALFNITQPEVFALVNQKNITGWSTLSNFIWITNIINQQQVLTMIAPENGNTFGVSLWQRMVRGALSMAFLGPEMLAFNQFWLNEGVPIVRDTTLSEKAKWAKVYAKFLDVLFTEHPDYYATFYSLDMDFWGSFYQMFETALIFYQDEHVSELVLGDVASCPLLIQFNATIFNKTVLLPNTVRGQFKQFYNALVKDFESTTTLDGRLEIIDGMFGKFIGLQWNYFRWFQYIGLGNFGNFQQLVLYIATKSIVGGSIPENG
uniref:Uncharacterized protein n=1 Tax=Panagrellus redivivus TaxID=6233 RepID=A0A7E4VXJ1_PANRE